MFSSSPYTRYKIFFPGGLLSALIYVQMLKKLQSYLLLYRFMMGLGLCFCTTTLSLMCTVFDTCELVTFLTKIAAELFFRQEKNRLSPLSLGHFDWRLVVLWLLEKYSKFSLSCLTYMFRKSVLWSRNDILWFRFRFQFLLWETCWFRFPAPVPTLCITFYARSESKSGSETRSGTGIHSGSGSAKAKSCGSCSGCVSTTLLQMSALGDL